MLKKTLLVFALLLGIACVINLSEGSWIRVINGVPNSGVISVNVDGISLYQALEFTQIPSYSYLAFGNRTFTFNLSAIPSFKGEILDNLTYTLVLAGPLSSVQIQLFLDEFNSSLETGDNLTPVITTGLPGPIVIPQTTTGQLGLTSSTTSQIVEATTESPSQTGEATTGSSAPILMTTGGIPFTRNSNYQRQQEVSFPNSSFVAPLPYTFIRVINLLSTIPFVDFVINGVYLISNVGFLNATAYVPAATPNTTITLLEVRPSGNITPIVMFSNATSIFQSFNQLSLFVFPTQSSTNLQSIPAVATGSIVTDVVNHTQSSFTSNLRIVHAWPQFPNLNIYIDGLLLASNLQFVNVTNYASLPQGIHNFTIQSVSQALSSRMIVRQTIDQGSNITSPNITSPNITSPNITSPNITSPNITSPNITTPNITTPNITTPNITVPSIPAVLGTIQLQILEGVQSPFDISQFVFFPSNQSASGSILVTFLGSLNSYNTLALLPSGIGVVDDQSIFLDFLPSPISNQSAAAKFFNFAPNESPLSINITGSNSTFPNVPFPNVSNYQEVQMTGFNNITLTQGGNFANESLSIELNPGFAYSTFAIEVSNQSLVMLAVQDIAFSSLPIGNTSALSIASTLQSD